MKLMLTSARACFLLVLLGSALAQVPAKGNVHLLIRPIDFKLVASNVKYRGAEADSGDVCLHYDALRFHGRNYYWSDAMTDGLFEEGPGSSRIYPPYDLAVLAGWHKPRPEDDRNNNVWGLFEFGDRLWMGSYGLGILSFDPRRHLWSRYDWQIESQPGEVTYLTFVDQKYLFFLAKGKSLVYSRTRQAGAELSRTPDARIDYTQHLNGSPHLQFCSREAKRSFYADLKREFARLKAGH